MIDTTKPIRLKGCITPLRAEPATDTYRIRGYCYPYTLSELDRDFENIPEPRKPREWWVNEYGCVYGTLIKSESLAERAAETGQTGRIHVIEWPEGAPLPEWPEGA